ncbi:MAG: zeta toxin family protein [Gammaproteobacteria bacterium]|nr:zeta toxin family protein [Gammaproteobacteria bacterium]
MKPAAPSPRFTIFGGPNGSGKSTAYVRFVSAGFDSGEYLNPDEIARSMRGPGDGGSAFGMRAGREVVERTRALVRARRSLVRESTLTGREIIRSIERAMAAGYRLVLVFVAVSSPATTRGRIAVRVAKGGHDIPVEVQDRRFPRSIDNLRRVVRLVDVAYLLDNAGLQYRLTATVCGGRLTFLDTQGAVWAEQGTADLPRAELLKTREEALKGLRAAEGITGDLEVREPRGSYVAVSPQAAGAGMK